MKTQLTQTARDRRQTMRQALVAIAGVAVAVLCALVLLSESNSSPDQSATLVGTTVSAISESVVNRAEVAIHDFLIETSLRVSDLVEKLPLEWPR